MHLFGNDTNGAHLRHFHARHYGDGVELDWEVRNAPSLRWRVLRSQVDFATSAEPTGPIGQVLITEGPVTHVHDQALDGRTTYFYTVFCANEAGAWQRQAEIQIKPHEVWRWLHPHAESSHGLEDGVPVHSLQILTAADKMGAWLSPTDKGGR
jgi:hypothetical protein